MWSPWGKQSPRLRSHSSDFRCSSFKDIQNLCSDDPGSPQNHHSLPSTTAKRSTVFHRVRTATSILRQWPRVSDKKPEPVARMPTPKPQPSPLISDPPAKQPDPSIEFDPSFSIPGCETRIVVYYTSLRVVRPTFEACRDVQSILSGFRVSIDERDLSMDSRFMEELQTVLGAREMPTLPRVFIGGRYVGGAEELKHLHEIGKLKKLVEGLPAAEPGVCETCGGYRFVLCNDCSGSHKIYSERVGFRSCSSCNQNGLIRCPSCLAAPL
ncbi:hypothetical protein Nepgr_014630 [Nepenthes gracilis]|uniref:Glutaredoxin domain-containing protein n=1 Tax=Nepenthes gracilis TaxID=150966 RepID=A0AAD3SL54_NEPGR|nr:hypothetical protein Nepgr_014630 [Nepenthes gracilis]